MYPYGQTRSPLAGLPICWFRLVGLALFPFAAMVFWISGRAESRAGLVRAVCLMDWSWVLGSALLLILGWSAFTWAGAALVDAMAVAVSAYAVLQRHFLGVCLTRAESAALLDQETARAGRSVAK